MEIAVDRGNQQEVSAVEQELSGILADLSSIARNVEWRELSGSELQFCEGFCLPGDIGLSCPTVGFVGDIDRVHLELTGLRMIDELNATPETPDACVLFVRAEVSVLLNGQIISKRIDDLSIVPILEKLEDNGGI